MFGSFPGVCFCSPRKKSDVDLGSVPIRKMMIGSVFMSSGREHVGISTLLEDCTISRVLACLLTLASQTKICFIVLPRNFRV